MATLRSNNLDLYMKWKNVGEVKLGYYADAECSDTPHVPCVRYQLLQTCIMFTGGVCMSECAAYAQGPNFTSPTIFHFIYKSKLLLLKVAIVVIAVTSPSHLIIATNQIQGIAHN